MASDLLMVLCLSGITGIKAESQAGLRSDDPLLAPPGLPKFEVGKCFELDGFEMNLEAQPTDSDAAKNAAQPVIQSKDGQTSLTTKMKYAKGVNWQPPYLNPVGCSRRIDNASTLLFQGCAKKTPYEKAAIIGRRVVGGGGNKLLDQTTSHLMTYFRVDFEKVQIIQVTWTANEEGIREEIRFVCTSASAQYSQQLHTGGHAAALEAGKWTMGG